MNPSKLPAKLSLPGHSDGNPFQDPNDHDDDHSQADPDENPFDDDYFQYEPAKPAPPRTIAQRRRESSFKRASRSYLNIVSNTVARSSDFGSMMAPTVPPRDQARRAIKSPQKLTEVDPMPVVDKSLPPLPETARTRRGRSEFTEVAISPLFKRDSRSTSSSKEYDEKFRNARSSGMGFEKTEEDDEPIEIEKASRTDPWAGGSRGAPIPDEEDGEGTTKGWRLVLMIIVMCLTVATVTIDGTIVATVTPTLASQWDALHDIGWYGTAYLLPIPTLQPLWGKVYPHCNTKWLMLVGLLIFEGGSLTCALANSSIMFIMGRAVAGIGSSILGPGALIIVQDIIPKAKRPLMSGLTAIVAGTASCAGPLLGGVFTTDVSWNWCFYINLPLGGTVAIAMLLLYRPIPRNPGMTFKQVLFSLDIPGCLLLSGCVVCLLLGLNFGSSGSWTSPHVIALLAVSGFLLIVLIAEQYFVPDRCALLPKSIMKKRGIIISSLFGFFAALGQTSQVYYLPIYFQSVKGVSAQQSGIDVLPYIIAQTLAGLLAAIIIQLTGYFNPAMLFGSAIFAVGAGLIYTFNPNTSTATEIGYQILAGTGTGICQLMAQGIAQQLLDYDEAPIGLAMVFMVRQLGSTIAVTVCSTVFNAKLLRDLLSNGLPSMIAAKVAADFMAGTSGISQKFKAAAAAGTSAAIDQVFIVPIVMAGLGFVVALFHDWNRLQKPARNTTNPGGSHA